jgi:hypothetical protein
MKHEKMKESHHGQGTTHMENGSYKLHESNDAKHEMNSIKVTHEKMHLHGKGHVSNVHHMAKVKHGKAE